MKSKFCSVHVHKMGAYLVMIHEGCEAAVDYGIEQRGTDRHHDDQVEDVFPCESHS